MSLLSHSLGDWGSRVRISALRPDTAHRPHTASFIPRGRSTETASSDHAFDCDVVRPDTNHLTHSDFCTGGWSERALSLTAGQSLVAASASSSPARALGFTRSSTSSIRRRPRSLALIADDSDKLGDDAANGPPGCGVVGGFPAAAPSASSGIGSVERDHGCATATCNPLPGYSTSRPDMSNWKEAARTLRVRPFYEGPDSVPFSRLRAYLVPDPTRGNATFNDFYLDH
jgi:hypothetical protein